MVNGVKPTISYVSGEPIYKLGTLIRFFTNETNGYSLGEITILSLKTDDNSIFSGISKIAGIPVSRERNNSSVFYTTASKFKGLESHVVIVIDIDADSFIYENKKGISMLLVLVLLSD